MAIDPSPPCPLRLRRTPRQFSWVDHRLVRDHYIDHLNHQEMGLYLFLVTVADAKGVSFYGDASLTKRLGMTVSELEAACDGLVRHQLIAFKKPIYQVLALGGTPTVATSQPRPDSQPVSLGEILRQAMEARG